MTNDPKIRIATVVVTVPIDIPASKHHLEYGPRVSLELLDDGCRVWDEVDFTDCGTSYTFADDRARWVENGSDRLPDIPYFDQVYRYLVEQYAANRANPLGKFLAPAVEAMDRSVAKRDGSRVYFARAGDRIKVGWSKNVATRIAQLQTGNPDPIQLLATTPGGRSLEREVHSRFADARVTGEWFSATPELLAYIADVIPLRLPA